jgi:carboxypeptidase Taq
MSQPSSYDNLKATFARMRNLSYAAEILSKDMETVLAKGSHQDRINQLVAIGETTHAIMCDKRVEDWLDDAEANQQNLSAEDQRNLHLMRREWVHEASLPDDLAREASRVAAEGEQIHTQNYKSGDWSKVRDWYTHSFAIARQVGQAKQAKMGLASAYEALLDQFSPGLRAAQVEQEFSALDKALRVMIPEAFARQKSAPAALPITGPFPREAQMVLNHALAKLVGFDTNRGILYAIDGHPSSAGSPDDSRITTRCNDTDFFDSIYSTVHEAGHAIYGQNLPAAWRYQPAGDHMGMGVHESQSMIIEYQACMSGPFLDYLSGELQKTFNRANDPALSAENLKRTLWHSQPSFIRVQADELTYPLHVILRHDLEQRIINGTLEVKDLPDAWNDGMKQRLGVVPPDASKGCMQDVHWPCGMIGYFPAYTLGAMGAAQFFAAAKRADPTVLPEITKGNFKPLNDWQRANIHSKGSLLSNNDLFTKATGAPLNAQAYLNHLSERYLGRPYTPGTP